MWAEAIFTKDDLEEVTGQLFPLRIALGNDGNVLLSDRRDLSLLPDVGLRMVISAEIDWPVLGVHVPVSIRAATLEVRPETLETPAGATLAFRLRLDGIDVSMLPEFVDRSVVELVNRELEARHVELSWKFTKTLSHAFALPEALMTTGTLDLHALSGRVKITGDALALAVLFRATALPRGPKPVARSDEAPSLNPPPSPPPPARSRTGSSPALLGALGTLAVFAGGGLVAILSRKRRQRSFLEQLRAAVAS